MNFIKNIYEKLFIDTSWEIVFSESLEEFIKGNYHIIKSPVHEWYADPFIYQANNEITIICEVKSEFSNFGYIGSFVCSKNGISKKPIKLIKEKFHMSFPNLFFKNNSFWIMPETCQDGNLRLYKGANLFSPFKLDRILIPNCYYADSIIYKNELFCYNPSTYSLDQYELNGDKYRIKKTYNDKEEKSLRPAGQPINNIIYFQNCKNKYGENIIDKIKKKEGFYKANDLSNAYLINIEKFCKANNYSSYHTLNFSGKAFVFDVLKTRFNFWKCLFYLIRKIKPNIKFKSPQQSK